jgi:hypothetical protein
MNTMRIEACPRQYHLSAFLRIKVLLLMAGIAITLAGCQFPNVMTEPAAPIDGKSVGYTLSENQPVQKAASKPVLDPNTPGMLRFSHQQHIVDNGMTCDACHVIGANGRPGRPDHTACTSCHEIDETNPTADCLKCHVLSAEHQAAGSFEEIAVTRVPASGKFQFNHSSFTDVSVCISCHNKAEGSQKSTDNLRGDHSTLFPGVKKTGANPDQCSQCHTDINRNTPPSSHKDPGFTRQHGAMSKGADGTLCSACHSPSQCQNCHQQTKPESHIRPEWTHSHGKVGMFDKSSCYLCHNEQACRTCHSTEMPKDHTNFFRRRSHGNIAAVSRDRCLVCHKQDYCEACHVGSSPRVTKQPFHTPGSNCLTCHSPASGIRPLRRHGPLPLDSCMKCHRFD